jgi:ribulose-phosphate 3-epimerase
MTNFILAPSMLSCDFSRIGEEVSMINNSEADWFHIDVMDGQFVPNISFGFPVLKAIRKIATKPLDVHLMIVHPEKYIEAFRENGADHITVHYEACTHLHRTVHQIKDCGAKAGVALNPHTRVELLYDVLEDIDLVCIMAVNPGFGGQKFIYRCLDKIRTLREEIISRNVNVNIEVDGGVGLQNAAAILHAGADVLVAGNAIFNTADPLETIIKFKNLDLGNIE